MRQGWKLSAALLLAVLNGCTTIGPKFTPVSLAPNESTIYVYRPSNYDLGLMSALIFLDGTQVASLENGGYAALAVSPGEHTITQRWKAGLLGNSDLEKHSISTTVQVQKSAAAYVSLVSDAHRVASNQYNAIAVHMMWKLNQLPADEALPEISECRKVQATGI